MARQWAFKCSADNSGSDFGENIAVGVDNCTQALDIWMEEHLGEPGSTDDFNHASQVMWPDTREVGCGWNPQCKLVMCMYDPPGNVDIYID